MRKGVHKLKCFFQQPPTAPPALVPTHTLVHIKKPSRFFSPTSWNSSYLSVSPSLTLMILFLFCSFFICICFVFQLIKMQLLKKNKSSQSIFIKICLLMTTNVHTEDLIPTSVNHISVVLYFCILLLKRGCKL